MVQDQRQMAARVLYDRIDLRRVGIESPMPAHHFFVEVPLIAAARHRKTRESPPKLSFQMIPICICIPPESLARAQS